MFGAPLECCVSLWCGIVDIEGAYSLGSISASVFAVKLCAKYVQSI